VAASWRQGCFWPREEIKSRDNKEGESHASAVIARVLVWERGAVASLPVPDVPLRVQWRVFARGHGEPVNQRFVVWVHYY